MVTKSYVCEDSLGPLQELCYSLNPNFWYQYNIQFELYTTWFEAI